ncbi:MAG: ribosome silencing factor [Burkholderiaceae bacterium]
MDIRRLQRVIVDGLEDVKAQNIVVFNTEHLSALFERVIIASGTSNRQTKALASGVREAVRDAGYPPPRLEGEVNGEWIIVDCGAAVVHVMQPSIRDYYHLEEIWGDKPVKMKLGSASTSLVKAEEPGQPKTARRAAATKSGTRTAPARKPAARRAAGPVTAARKTATPTGAKTVVRAASRKPTPAVKASVTRVVGVKRAAVKAAQARPAARKAAPRKTAARKAPART